MRICAVQDGDHIRWFERRNVAGCSAGFGKFYSRYEAAGILRSGSVGGAYSIFADAAAAYRIEHAILVKDPTAAFCDDPFCTSCGLRTYAPARDGQIFSFRAAESRPPHHGPTWMMAYTHVIASIDPDHPVPLAGRAGGARITNHVHDPLEANILAIFEAGACNAVFISIDALFVGHELSDALLAACAALA